MRTKLRGVVAALFATTTLFASACGGNVNDQSDSALPMPTIDDTNGLVIAGEQVADADLLAAARQQTVRWVTGSGAESAELTAKRFEAETGVKIDMTRMPSTKLNERVLSEAGVDRLSFDVVTITDSALAAGLSDQGVFVPYTDVPDYDALANMQNVVFNGGDYYTAYHPVATFAYNNQKIDEADAPKSWKDLLDPKWKGRIGILGAGAGGNTVDLVAFQEAVLGQKYWADLAAQQPRLFDVTSVQIDSLARGEVDIITAGFNTTYAVELSGAPISLVIPEEGMSGSSCLQGVTTAGANNAAAKLFMNWTMSKSGQQFAAAQGYVSART
ncbi:MAG: extracellular solute-binding protein, partial [Comamonadaceae bacterium]